MSKTFGIFVVLAGALFILTGTASAQCSPSEDGDAGPNTITCSGDVTPADGEVEGVGDDDSITNNGTLNGGIYGDGDGAGGAFAGDGGNDNITNNDTVNGSIAGDNATGSGGNDTITNNGFARRITGDGTGSDGGNDLIHNTSNGTVIGDITGDGIASGNGGTDTIINDGTVESTIVGDGGSGVANDDVITNNGFVQNIEGDGGSGGGADTITNNGEVTFDILGQAGDDVVNIKIGSQVGGTIDGGDDTDTLNFTGTATQADIDAINTVIAGCGNPCGGTVSAGGQTYNFANFETLQNLLTLFVDAGLDVSVFLDGAPSAPATNEICTGAVKVFRLPNGDLEVFSGFDILVPNGFLVAKIPQAMQQAGGVFSNADAPIAGWTATLEIIDGSQKIVGRDAAGNIINQDCQW